ncbi:MAG: hypothetical protein ACRC3Y_11980, partial [Romboutsia sp.]|uniref:hypothetical protein n=1 Tax=Romboutsia sp. TaxID=1965302 RepID=UPI003F398240
KDLLKDKIFKRYVFITMLIMLALCFMELYPEKNTVNSILSNVFLIIFLISSVLYLVLIPLTRKIS